MTSDELGDLLSELGIDRLRHANGNWYGCCPIHGERRPSWGISDREPHVFGCFSCGKSGTLFTLLRDTFQWPVDEIEDKLGAADNPDYFGRLTTELAKPLDLKSVEPRRLYPYKLTNRALQYALGRGLSRSTIETARLLYDHNDDRLLFPWYVDGKLVGATGRALRDGQGIPKIIAYFNLNKASVPYMPSGKVERNKTLVIVEGEIDALKVYQAGYRNVIALAFGRLSKSHVQFITSLFPSKVVLFFDSDATGRKLSDAYKTELQRFDVHTVLYKYVRGSDKLDPGGLSDQMIRFLIQKALKSSGIWSNFSLA